MRTIRSQMTLYLIIGICVIFFIFGFFFQRRLQFLPVYIQDQNQEIASARADQISHEIEGALNQIKLIANASVIVNMDLDEIKTFLPTVAVDERFRNLTISDLDGNAWTTNDISIDISGQEQYQKIFIEGLEYHISDPFYSPFVPENIPIITIAHVVKDNGVTVGLINGVISTVFLDQTIALINSKDQFYAYIIDQRGYVIAHPSESISIDYHISSWIEDDAKVTTLLGEQRGILNYQNLEGKQELAIYESIEGTPGWKIVLTISYADAYAEYNALTLFLYVALIVTIIAMILFAIIYSNTIAKPIAKLTHTFKIAGQGNLNVKADESLKNEIGLAGKQFNTMIQRIKELTFRDAVTGLYNANSFMLELPEKFGNAPSGEHYAIIIVSIDDFKRINSLGGYETGNLVLQMLSQKLSAKLRPTELIGRYFGDEIIMFIHSMTPSFLKERTASIHQVFNQPFHLKSIEFRVHASIGVSMSATKEVDYEQIIHHATIAKLDAKKSGGHQIAYYKASINDAIIEEQSIEDELYQAMKKNQLYLCYQPIIDTKTNEILGSEALLRWNHPFYGEISTARIVAIAERNGLIIDIGKWVFNEAWSQLIAWNKQQLKPHFMSINVSALQLEDSRFINTLKDYSEKIGHQASLIHLEITETNMMTNVEEKIKTIKKIKAMGYSISIDDFGTGYSSLAYFSQFQVDTLKIDAQFVREMFTEEKAKTIIDTIVSMAKSMHLLITAEGVETEEQRIALERLGVDFYQGYLFSQPLKPDQYSILLLKNKTE